MPHLPTDQIIVQRTERQRRELDDISELQASIARQGQINAIIVKRLDDKIILVAGERRLRACIALEREIEVKFWDELTPLQAKEIELEENMKRSDLPWRDQVASIAELHQLHIDDDKDWSVNKTADQLSIGVEWTYICLMVAKNLDNKILTDATGIRHAYSVLQRASERKTASIVAEIGAAGASAFGAQAPQASANASQGTSAGPQSAQGKGESPLTNGQAALRGAFAAPPPAPILNTSFLTWAPTYTGPKFNLIHCDFPYGVDYTSYIKGHDVEGVKYDFDEDTYWLLMDCFCNNLDKLASYSSHVVFWFSMNFYEETKKRLSAAGLKVQNHPLVWYKSDNAGIAPAQNIYPRRIYETAFLASLGNRPLTRIFGNCYGAPMTSNPLHPSQKPEPVLRHFFSGLVDATTDLLDPTCGSGSALRAAEDVGARSVLGLELNPDFAKAANAATVNARLLRKAAL